MIEFYEPALSGSGAAAAYTNYKSFDSELKGELQRQADSFVKTGYMLKIARDTNILAESRYKTVFEYAKHELGLDSTSVSRYISINDRFSVDGYSELLEEKYQGFGYSKLSEMLTLPPAIVEEFDEEMTVNDIRTIKKEYQDEQKISDIEVAIEAAEIKNEEKDNTEERKPWEPQRTMEKLLYNYFGMDEHIDIYACLCMDDEDYTPEEVCETLNPSGSLKIEGRIPGEGSLMMNLRDIGQNVTITNMRTLAKIHHTWRDVAGYIKKLTGRLGEAKQKWEEVYGREFPGKKKSEAVSAPAATSGHTVAEPTKDISNVKPAQKEKVSIVKPVEKKKPVQHAEKKEMKPDAADYMTQPEEEPEKAYEKHDKASEKSEKVSDQREIISASDKKERQEPIPVPAEMWRRMFIPYYEEWKENIDRANNFLEMIRNGEADQDNFDVNVDLAETHIGWAARQFEKIKDLPPIE